MSTPHKHATEIHAWADGFDVQYRLITKQQDWPWIDLCSFAKFDSIIFEFRLKPHRWQPEIDAINAGVAVQGRCIGSVAWWPVEAHVDFDSPELEFRIKPEMLRFRISLHKYAERTPYTLKADDEKQASYLSNCSCFVRWLGDWQEVDA